MHDDPRLIPLSEALRDFNTCNATHDDLASAILRAIDAPTASGAPVGRDGAEQFTCPQCGSHKFGTLNCTSPYSEWIGHCSECKFAWNRKHNDHRYFKVAADAPRPADLRGEDGEAVRAAWALDESDALVEARAMWYADKTVTPGDAQETCFVKGYLACARARREKGGVA